MTLNRQGWLLLPLVAVAPLGCGKTPTAPPPGKPPEVLVSVPVVKDIVDYEDFTGRTEAVASVEVRARVSGYLQKVHFKEGADVKHDELLFEIDPRPYEAELARAEAGVRQSQVRLDRLRADYDRAVVLRNRQAISQEELERVAGDRAEAEAAMGKDRAIRDLAQLNLNYTKVKAQIGGCISRLYIDAGNLVKADDTILTSIVDTDPMYAMFDVDERTLLRVRRLIESGKIKSARDAEVPVLAALSDEEGFPQKGVINFVDNRVDPNTGTLRLRGVFPNPRGIMSPGLFVRVRVPLGEPASAVLVAEQALGTDQGQKFVYVINDRDEAIYRRVQIGRLSDGLRVIKEGLSSDERIVVSGLQRIRPNNTVTPRMVEMPVSGAAQ